MQFPDRRQKGTERPQYRFVRALSDKELVKKLLVLDLMATTAKDARSVLHTHCHLRQP